MPTDPNAYNLFAPANMGTVLRDEAIDRVEAAAPPDFLAAALVQVRLCAKQLDYGFTTDDVWSALPAEVRPPEPRAMGAVMRQAARLGVIRATSDHRPSERPECHRNPKRVWIAA